MADNQEDVVYSFEGDVSSLRSATQQAISILDKYDAAFKRIASSDSFKASKTSATGFHRAVNGLVKQVNTLTSALNTSGNTLESSMPDGAAAVHNATRDLSDVLSYLDSTTSVTSNDLKFLTEVLQSTRGSLDSVTSRATLLTSSLQSLKQIESAATSPVQAVGNAVEETGKKMSQAPTWGYRVQEAYQLSGKSASESAKAFLEAERSASRMTNVQSAVRQVTQEMKGLGSQSQTAWSQFAERINLVVQKLQSFKSKASESLGKVKSVVDQVKSAFRRTSTESDKTGDSLSKLKSVATAVSSKLSNLAKSTRNSHDGFRSLKAVIDPLKRAFLGLVSVPISQWLSEAAKQSINYTENVNLFNVAMGESVDKGKTFVNQMSEVYGIDPSNLMRYAGNFYQLADAIDMPADAAATLSLSLTKSVNDISSLFNVPVEQVFNDLSSGMQGMSRAVRKYGMDIRTTTLQQTALSLGLKGNVEDMSEANRQGLRYVTMMKQAANATGDYANTIESPANQLKIFKEQISQLGRAIGDMFIGPITTAISYLNGLVMAIRMVLTFINAVADVIGAVTGASSKANDTTDKTAKNLNKVGTSAKKAGKQLKSMLAPFDELNVLQDKADAGGGGGGAGGLGSSDILDPKIADAISKMKLNLEDVKMKAKDVRDAVLSFLGFELDGDTILGWDSKKFEQNLINKFPKWTKTIQSVFANWSSIINSFKSLMSSLGDVAAAIWSKVAGFISKYVNDNSVSSFIDDIASAVSSLASYISSNADTIASVIILVAKIAGGIKLLVTLTPAISGVVSAISTIAPAISAIAPTLGIVAAVAAALYVLCQNSTDFTEALKSFFSSFISGIVTIAQGLAEPITTIGNDIVSLWTEYMHPTIQKIGDALVPVIQTLQDLWEDLTVIIIDTGKAFGNVWSSSIKPTVEAIFKAVQTAADLCKKVWNEIIGPIIKSFGDDMVRLWQVSILPVVQNIIGLVNDLKQAYLTLWNNVLAPYIDWIVSVFGPLFSGTFSAIVSTVSAIIGNLIDIISGIITSLRGVIQFITGVFTGDWKKAWKGVLKVFEGIFELLEGIMRTAMNAVIGVINIALSAITGAINGIVRAINKLKITLPDWVPGYGGKTLSFNLKQVSNLKIPYLESGGVVTSPTMAMIGEGRYNEAVIPLGNSPQMKELISKISDATSGRHSDEPVQVNVYIGNEQIAEYMQRANRRTQLQTNGGL